MTGGAGEPAPFPMTEQPDDVITDECQDDWCPECFGDDLIDLPDGTQRCADCRALIDY